MKRFFAIFLMVVGLASLIASIWLYIANAKEDEQAQELTEYYLPKLIDSIKNGGSQNADADESEPEASDTTNAEFIDTEMKVTVIDGHGFVGYIAIPELNLELPIMAETNNDKLKIAPCRFYGSAKANNLVIGAHNYSRHFGQIGDLRADDEIFITDMDGNTYKYAVMSVEILQPNDVDLLTNAEYDLTLYTCTYGGRTRITVRCDRIE